MPVTQFIKSILPDFLSKKHSKRLRKSTEYVDIGTAGPVITDVFEPIKDIPGWFNVDDCAHFFLLFSLQNSLGMKGDMLEIGSYHGRSTAVIAYFLGSEEKIVVCDAFQQDTKDSYDNKPSPEKLVKNIQELNAHVDREQIIIHQCLSNNLELDTNQRFRFIHIDGGHSAEQAYSDLALCSQHLMSQGVIVMDDYQNEMWPGVTEGTDQFLKEYDNFQVLADLNRHGAYGRKLYLIRS